MTLGWAELVMRFVIGGAVVVSATLLAEQKLPLWSGLINNFPALTMTSLLILVFASSLDSAVKLSTETLITLPVYIAFLVAFVVIFKFTNSKIILFAGSLTVWFVAASLFLYTNNLVKIK